MTVDENAPGFDLLPNGGQVQTYLFSKVPQASMFVWMSLCLTEFMHMCVCVCGSNTTTHALIICTL